MVPVSVESPDGVCCRYTLYVAHRSGDTVSVINGTTDTKEKHDIPVGIGPVVGAYDR